VSELRAALVARRYAEIPIVVVNDGSTDGCCGDPRILAAHTIVLEHTKNLGKGAALLTGLRWAAGRDVTLLVTLDADAQHPIPEALRLFFWEGDREALVLGIRDLEKAGAPGPSQFSNAFSNLVLSLFGGRRLNDTQCGLRRYPVKSILALGARHPGYALESDIVLRAARRGLPIVEVLTDVHYPAKEDRVTHFHSFRDPAQIVLRVVTTTLAVPHVRWSRRLLEWSVWGVLLTLLFLALR
jgi:glycosyltransferase involved in cell wall biosynthesis